MTVSNALCSPGFETHTPSVVLENSARRQSLLGAHMVLTKVRLNSLVVFTTVLGYLVGARSLVPAAFDGWQLLWTCVGTFLAAAGASAFNQAIEAPRDIRMKRTALRPLCTGRLSRTYATSLGLILAILGVAILCPASNGLTALLAAGNVLLYVLIYTPLKPRSTANTLVGAIVGGVPPVLGWTAATGHIAPGALVLGAILFVWQIPHFLALCWLYRLDYARGGYRMLPTVESSGRLTSRLALTYSLLLMPLCLLLVTLGHGGLPFALIAFVLTLGLIVASLRFARTRRNADARRLFLASIIYLPLLCATLMFDARGPAEGFEQGYGGLMLAPGPVEPFIEPGSLQAERFEATLTRPASPPSTDAP